MKFKILITGKNRKIASADVSKLLEKELECTAVECPPFKSQLVDTVYDERPAAVLIFLKDEDQRDIKVYDVIRDYAEFYAAAVIVVTDAAGRKQFAENSRLRRVLFLPHDIPFFTLCDRLSEVKKEMEENEEKTRFVVYDNTGAVNAGNTKKHILVVDDDPQQLVQINDHLSEFYDVSLINSGKQVIRCLEKMKPDLIFLDYLMPEMTGPDVLVEIQRDGRFRDIPVVFLTGVNEKETVIKTIKEFKPQGFILKPATKIELVTKVIEILG